MNISADDDTTSEIYRSTLCLDRELQTMALVQNLLLIQGYHSVSHSLKVWRRGNRSVVICLGDDFITCAADWRQSLDSDTKPSHNQSVCELFDINTLIITDNYPVCATPYRVLRLPTSYWGTYSYQPQQQNWDPQRRWNLNLNRIDTKRLTIFFELMRHSQIDHPQQADCQIFDTSQDWANLNCHGTRLIQETARHKQDRFIETFAQLSQSQQQKYQLFFDQILFEIPYKNWNQDLETSHLSAWLNLVVETYSNNHAIAFSEKIFRALQTPCPWMLYGGKYSVNHLIALGFDVFTDLINHRSDHMDEQHTSEFGDRPVVFMADARAAVEHMQTLDRDWLIQRCHTAAQHNQRLLSSLRDQWIGTDLSDWLCSVNQAIGQ